MHIAHTSELQFFFFAKRLISHQHVVGKCFFIYIAAPLTDTKQQRMAMVDLWK
jgi:hypothetical protein